MNKIGRLWAKTVKVYRERGLGQALYVPVDTLVWRFYPPKRALHLAEKKYLDQDLNWDKLYNVDTFGEVKLSEAGVNEDEAINGNNVYRPIHGDIFEEAMANLPIIFEHYTFIDYGSGKGKALLMASSYSFSNIIGLEYAQRLHEAAEFNISQYNNPAKKCSQIHSLLIDATKFSPPIDPLVCFFFNPFGIEILEKALDIIFQSWKSHPRHIILIYANHRHVKEKIKIFFRIKGVQCLRQDTNIAIFALPAPLKSLP